jgi:chromosome segregation ATPase
MTDYAKAVNDIRFIANRFQGFLGLADALTKLGSIEQGLVEAQAQLAKTREDEERIAESIRADASARAESIVAEAKQVAETHQRGAAEAAQKLADLNEAIAKTQAEYDALSKEHEAFAQKHAILVGEHQRIKDLILEMRKNF